MYSARFNLQVVLTEHATQRMAERQISLEQVLEIIDSGTVKEAGGLHYWLCRHLPDRTDNLLCVEAV